MLKCGTMAPVLCCGRRFRPATLVASLAAIFVLSFPGNCQAHLMLRGPSESAAAQAADHDPHFDFYVYSMSFQPEFCYSHRSQNWDGCSHPDDEWAGSLTIHGLWPERNDGSWPSMCTTEAFDPSVIDELGRERFEQHWPNVKSPPNSPDHDEFWTHEWTKHGTCSGLSQVDYFASALDSYVPTPPIVRLREGSKINKEALITAYGGGDMVVLVCDAKRYLSEVRVCLSKSEDGSASDRIPCSDVVLREGSCYDKDVYISTFPTTSSSRSSTSG